MPNWESGTSLFSILQHLFNPESRGSMDTTPTIIYIRKCTREMSRRSPSCPPIIILTRFNLNNAACGLPDARARLIISRTYSPIRYHRFYIYNIYIYIYQRRIIYHPLLYFSSSLPYFIFHLFHRVLLRLFDIFSSIVLSRKWKAYSVVRRLDNGIGLLEW